MQRGRKKTNFIDYSIAGFEDSPSDVIDLNYSIVTHFAKTNLSVSLIIGVEA
jgi:hypothetical protein